MIFTASKGHFLTQIPHPIVHRKDKFALIPDAPHRMYHNRMRENQQRTDAKWLRNKGKFTLGTNLNTELSELYNRTGLFTFLVALLGLAFLGIDNRDTGQVLFLSGFGFTATALFLRRHLFSVKLPFPSTF